MHEPVYLYVSLFIALFSILAPLITTIMNNKHVSKKIRMENNLSAKRLHEQHIKDVFENFLASYGVYRANPSEENQEILRQTFYICLLYIPEEQQPIFLEFYEQLITDKSSEMKEWMASKIIPILQKLQQEITKQGIDNIGK